ncbi:unnamed protein product [Polarella glacialis]|uniref:Uncharacterized protein n=1 Tax=Polarella glacialis TaxID=89957 RepID=A0A813JN32_POLGL|nr:unnamed protein product [Polarella glacialis]
MGMQTKTTKDPGPLLPRGPETRVTHIPATFIRRGSFSFGNEFSPHSQSPKPGGPGVFDPELDAKILAKFNDFGNKQTKLITLSNLNTHAGAKVWDSSRMSRRPDRRGYYS